MKVGQDARAVEIEAEAQRPQAASHQRLGDTTSLGGTNVEHEEAAATRTHQLAADGTCLERSLVVFVDRGIAHLGSELALVGPMLVQELAIAIDLAVQE